MINKLEDLERRLHGTSSCLYAMITSKNIDVDTLVDAIEYIAENLEQQSKEIGIILSATKEGNNNV